MLLALWVFIKQRGVKSISIVFVIISVLVSPLLVITGYKGAEVVYRHGIGVMQLPEINKQLKDNHGQNSHDHSTHNH